MLGNLAGNYKKNPTKTIQIFFNRTWLWPSSSQHPKDAVVIFEIIYLGNLKKTKKTNLCNCSESPPVALYLLGKWEIGEAFIQTWKYMEMQYMR